MLFKIHKWPVSARKGGKLSSCEKSLWGKGSFLLSEELGWGKHHFSAWPKEIFQGLKARTCLHLVVAEWCWFNAVPHYPLWFNKVSNAVRAFLPSPSPCFPLGLGREYCSPPAIITVLSIPTSSPMLWHFLVCVLSCTGNFFRAVHISAGGWVWDNFSGVWTELSHPKFLSWLCLGEALWHPHCAAKDTGKIFTFVLHVLD